MVDDLADHFPRVAAETQRFSLGRPRSFRLGGGRAAFLRSRGGRDPITCLWVLDSSGERLVADPRTLGGPEDAADLPPQEQARRERARELAGGITSYAVDSQLSLAAFALTGRLGLAPLDGSGPARLLKSADPVTDPRPSPDGQRVGYVSNGALVLADLNGHVQGKLAGPAGTACGLAEFVASEELGRFRGWWWAPDSQSLLAAVVDDSPVQVWWIADPAQPARLPVQQRYPVAGGANARVSLLCADADGGSPRPVTGWDGEAFPYLVTVHWSSAGPPLLLVSSRDQRCQQVLTVDPATAVATVLRTDRDAAWLDVTPGVPAWLADGRLLHVLDDAAADVRRLAVDGTAVSPASVHVAAVRGVGPDGAVLLVGTEDDPTSRHVYAVASTGEWEQLSTTAGVHDVVAGEDAVVFISASLDPAGSQSGSRAELRRGGENVVVTSHAQEPPLSPGARLLTGGERSLRIGIVLPRQHVTGTCLPVLLDPYGGPHHAKVLAAQHLWLEPQWLADQGFAVVVADGRGTPGRSLSWEKSVRGDLAEAALQDQVDALALAAAQVPDLDLTRVAIRGWSFGGYLSALAVLRRPDLFHAAIAGAPVTDWRLYDTAYTERYLGVDPDGADHAAYERSSLLCDAGKLSRPLLLVHGLADDNVVAAHTLRLSALLLEHGCAHDVLPLTGVTHLGGSGNVAENLLRLQVTWLRRALRCG